MSEQNKTLGKSRPYKLSGLFLVILEKADWKTNYVLKDDYWFLI